MVSTVFYSRIDCHFCFHKKKSRCLDFQSLGVAYVYSECVWQLQMYCMRHDFLIKQRSPCSTWEFLQLRNFWKVLILFQSLSDSRSFFFFLYFCLLLSWMRGEFPPSLSFKKNFVQNKIILYKIIFERYLLQMSDFN